MKSDEHIKIHTGCVDSMRCAVWVTYNRSHELDIIWIFYGFPDDLIKCSVGVFSFHLLAKLRGTFLYITCLFCVLVSKNFSVIVTFNSLRMILFNIQAQRHIY